MNKEEAAKFLDVSVRTLERLTQQGRIGVRYEKGRTRPTPVYDESELERVKPDIESKLYPHRPTVQPSNLATAAATGETGESDAIPASAASSDTALARVAELPAGMDRLLALMKALRESEPVSVPIADKPLLKLAEASALTGLSRGHLRQAIEEGKLKGKIVGRAWRVKRTDIDAYVKKL